MLPQTLKRSSELWVEWSYLIRPGLGTAPVKQHLLDGVCVGNAKAGGTLNLVYFGHCLISRAEETSGLC